MTIYSVYLPPLGTTEPPLEVFRLIPDKKSPWALIFPVFWLLFHRLWLALLAYLVFTFAVILLLTWKQHVAIAYLTALPGFYLLLEGQELVRGKLEHLGWRFSGMVEADNAEDAEFRYVLNRNNIHDETPLSHSSSRPVFRRPKILNQSLFPE